MDKAQAYAVLRIEPGCTQEEIKEAYAALSRQYHPEVVFKTVSLSSTSKR